MHVERLSVFDIFKIGVGPSSSHTLGPWRAAERFVRLLRTTAVLDQVNSIRVRLYGSLAKTGRGHGTDMAVQAGLLGADPVTCDMTAVWSALASVASSGTLPLGSGRLAFEPDRHIEFHADLLPAHPNALTFAATLDAGAILERTYYSVGGGFVVGEGDEAARGTVVTLPHPIDTAADVLHWCDETGWPIWRVVQENERRWRPDAQTRAGLAQCWQVMRESTYRGCRQAGELPGGLQVKRRAPEASARLTGGARCDDYPSWFEAIRSGGADFKRVLAVVSALALAVSEENAAFGRVVTAPTNGAAGVIPAVLQCHLAFGTTSSVSEVDRVVRFLSVASEIGCLFKKGATISAALGGCQAEIGVAAAMAAAALTEANGGSPRQALMAAEIAMEHHLGLTCDPVSGLVQIPCIERNAMGAIKAITASELALQRQPADARVSLDEVIAAMRQTAEDMSGRYKETSEAGLAVQVAVNLSDC